jgi:hypothetical protein
MEKLQVTEQLEGVSPAEMPEVLRIASELYAQDRAAIEQAQQRRELVRAAVEAGLPPEYLERAAATLQAHRATASQPRRRERRRLGPLILLGVGAGLLLSRALSRPPEPPPPPMVMPAAGPALVLNSPVEVDLSGYATNRLEDSMLATNGNDLAGLVAGLPTTGPRERTLNGIPFRLDGVVLVGPGESTSGDDVRVPLQPEVKGIPIGRRVGRLHFLHGTHWQGRDGQVIASYVMHYADGSQAVLPIRYGADVVDWWAVRDNSSEAARYRVAWRGSNGASSSHREGIRLFIKSWENPRPDVPIRSMDMVTGSQQPGRSAPAPFLVGLTAEEAPTPGSPPEPPPARIPDPPPPPVLH